ncbi:PLD nuclease N-terminal domain-containing protein [Chryseolinea lacunae]|uniref:PLDc_N domain-containing protein n=1 Tax=Chryseolinea lacunae TaxID=2801331 RepID=A0ABS1L3F1_9BACT|nr:PLD nuclease N-terminal domain-containing protein [Chryseolinea lacunae]MBL0745462.1 PLDc_N domain-containing protein [Chryseolinea lacunae]
MMLSLSRVAIDELLLLLVPFALWLWALIEIIRSDFKNNNKTIWLLVLIFLPFLGWLLYVIIGRDQRVKR